MNFYQCSENAQVYLSLLNNEENGDFCKGEMAELKINQVGEDDKEHRPFIRKIGNFVTITIGENHPMIDVHHIAYVFIETNHGFMFKDLKNQEEAKVEFILAKQEYIVNVYVYCNVHLLWSLH